MLAFIIISHASLYIGTLFLVLCIATGLYYLAEVAEENSVLTKKVISYLIYVCFIDGGGLMYLWIDDVIG